MGRLRQPGQITSKSKVVKPKATTKRKGKKNSVLVNGKKLNKAIAYQERRARQFHAAKQEYLVRQQQTNLQIIIR